MSRWPPHDEIISELHIRCHDGCSGTSPSEAVTAASTQPLQSPSGTDGRGKIRSSLPSTCVRGRPAHLPSAPSGSNSKTPLIVLRDRQRWFQCRCVNSGPGGLFVCLRRCSLTATAVCKAPSFWTRVAVAMAPTGCWWSSQAEAVEKTRVRERMQRGQTTHSQIEFQLISMRSLNGPSEGLFHELGFYGLGYSSDERTQPNTISPTYQCSIHKISVNFLLHMVASDFIIVVELTCEMALKSTQRSTLFHQSCCIVPPSFFCGRFLPEWKTAPFSLPHILWFRECRCLLSSFPALCQKAKHFFALPPAPRQYHSRLSFRRPKRTSRKGCRYKLERIFRWSGNLGGEGPEWAGLMKDIPFWDWMIIWRRESHLWEGGLTETYWYHQRKVKQGG